MKKAFHNSFVLFLIFMSFSVTAYAWGPERPTFTTEERPSYPVFNSVIDNPTIGDERDFVRVAEINEGQTNLSNEVEIVPGKQYLVYIYCHNNASTIYNDPSHSNSGTAYQTKLATFFPTVLTSSEKGMVSATISAENSNPVSVWDEAYMTTKTGKVLLNYVSGSAKIYNDCKTNGSVLPSDLFTYEGTYIGSDELNGVMPGGVESHCVVSYVLEAQELSGSIEKMVSKDGSSYSESEAVAPDEEVFFQLAIRNTGDVALSNVVVKDSLPEGFTLVSGSVTLRANESEVSDALSDNLLGTGYNLGTIGTGNTVYITYKAKAGSFDDARKELTSNAAIIYDSDIESGEKREATVTVILEGINREAKSDSYRYIIVFVIVALGVLAGYYFGRTHKPKGK